MQECLVINLPRDMLVMIMEMMGIKDTLMVCKALNISQELAYQYHSYDPKDYSFYMQKIYNDEKSKVVNPTIAKTLLKNPSFQSLADANDIVKYSILSQDIDLVRNALQDPRVNHQSKKCSPLRMACKYGSLDAVKLLVNDYGIDISAHENAGLCEASRGHIDIVKFFFSHPNVNNDHYFSALMTASEEGKSDIMRLLLADKRFDPDVNRSQGIITAAMYGNIEIVKLLLEDLRVNPAAQNNLTLTYAVDGANIKIVKLLLADHRVDPSDENNNAIICAAYKGDVDIVKLLLEDPRVNPADQKNQAILEAVTRGNMEIVSLLLADHRIDPSDQNNEAIICAAYKGDVEIAQLLLLDPRVNPSDQNNEAIIQAAENKHNKMVELLLQDPRVDPTDRNNIALRTAIEDGNLEIIKLLM